MTSKTLLKKILATAGRLCPVSLEVAGLTVQEMVKLGKLLSKIERLRCCAG